MIARLSAKLNWRPVLPLCILAVFAAQAGVAQDPARPPAGPVASLDTPEAHLGAGYEALRSDRYEAAAREFRAALQLDPKLALQARFPLAVALFELRDLEGARREFEAVRRASGDHPNLDYYLGRIDLTEGKLDAAISELHKAAVKPPFPDTAYYLGDAYFKHRQLNLAEAWLHKAADLNPRDSAVQHQLGSLYAEMGLQDQAKQAYARSEQLRRQAAEVSKLRIECAERLEHGSLEEARPICDRLFDSNDAERLTILGTLYGSRRYYAEAVKPFTRAAELQPASPQMQYNLAFDYFQLGRYREAREALAGAVKRWPDLYPVNALYGSALFELADDAAAIEALERAHKLNPGDAATSAMLYELNLRLGKKSLAGGRYPAALAYVVQAARIGPGEAEPHQLMAEIYGATGRKAEAAEERRLFDRLTSEQHAPGQR
jgi:tetratricopeptide (TPR) repeat protein